jgi:hypothetical protein
LRRAISKKEKYERKIKDIDAGEKSPLNDYVEKVENIEMGEDLPIDYAT